MPFEGFTVDPRGKAIPCPAWTDNPEMMFADLRTGNETINDIFHGDKMSIMRDKMSRDERVDACSVCYRKEAKGLLSQRIKVARRKRVEKNLDDLFADVEDIVTVKHKPKVKSLELNFSNQCNLACAMCNHTHSSGWLKQEESMPEHIRKHRDAYPGFLAGVPFKQYTLKKNFVDSIIENISDIELIMIKGGEPLYDKNCLYLLDALTKVKPDIKIIIVSNITHIPAKTLAIFEKLSNLNINASIDGVGKTYEWVRGYDFDKINDNYEMLSQLPNIRRLDVNMCTSIYNIHNVMDTINHFMKYFVMNYKKRDGTFDKKYSFAFGFAGEPWSDQGILLEQDKKEILNIFEKDITALINKNIFNKQQLEDAMRLQFLPSHKMLGKKELDKWRKMFYDYVVWMDTVRGFNLRYISKPVDNLMRLYD
ncbi:MAG: hypothetical protein CMK56_04040 [Proteobacteria bacterium]|nr:hypothetical protein [Pseudomonadota bacterium]